MCTERHTKMRLHSYKSAVCALYAVTPATTTMPNNCKCERALLKYTLTQRYAISAILLPSVLHTIEWERKKKQQKEENKKKKNTKWRYNKKQKIKKKIRKIVDYLSSTCCTGAKSFNLIEMTMAMVVSIHFRLLYAIPHIQLPYAHYDCVVKLC